MNNLLKDVTVVITTFYAGNKLEKCISKIPKNTNILIIDNAGEKINKNYYEKKFNNLCYHLSAENLGVPRSYSLANKLVKTRYMFNTQPDVSIKENCIENLLVKVNSYPNAIILSPTIFHNENYLVDGDYKILKFRDNTINFHAKKVISNLYNSPPAGDLCVDAVTGTAMLIDRSKLKIIDDWDKNIFNYFEDMDLCLRGRLQGFEIIKIRSAEVDHLPFSSHDNKHEDELNYSRNWHQSWSHFYFKKKHEKKLTTYIWGFLVLAKSSIKTIIYIFINKQKYKTHKAKTLGFYFSLLNKKSSFRPKI